MSLQPLCERSMRTGVRSTRIGNGRPAAAARAVAGEAATAGRRDAPRGTSTDCRGPSGRSAAPGRQATGTRGHGRRPPVRWRSRRSGRRAAGRPETRPRPPRNAVPANADSRRTGIRVPALGRQLQRQVIAVDGAEEEAGPDALVEVLALAAEAVQLGRPRRAALRRRPRRQKASSGRLRTSGSLAGDNVDQIVWHRSNPRLLVYVSICVVTVRGRRAVPPIGRGPLRGRCRAGPRPSGR